MARHLRVEYPGAIYHVMTHGGEKTKVFRTEADRLHFLKVLCEALARYEAKLFAYVLMDTHYHLAVQTCHPNLSRFMHYLNSAYTVWMNKRNRRRGHLFQGRYRGIVMENAGYLLSVSGYLHLNPVRTTEWEKRPVAERLKHVQQYRWSSLGQYTQASRIKPMPPIACNQVWGQLGARSVREGRRRYAAYVKGWLQKEEQERGKPAGKRNLDRFNPFSELKLGILLGGEGFCEYIQGLLESDRELTDEVVNYRQWRRTVPISDVLAKAASAWGATLDEVCRRGRPNEARDAVIYLCRECAEKGLREIGEPLGIRTAAVGHALKRVNERQTVDRRLRHRLAEAKDTVIRLLET